MSWRRGVQESEYLHQLAADLDANARMVRRYGVSWSALRADAELRAIQSVRIMGFGNRIFYLRRMLTRTRELRRRLEG